MRPYLLAAATRGLFWPLSTPSTTLRNDYRSLASSALTPPG